MAIISKSCFKQNTCLTKLLISRSLSWWIQGLSRTCAMKFKDFKAPVLFSSTFKALNLGLQNSNTFKDFQGCVGTLMSIWNHKITQHFKQKSNLRKRPTFSRRIVQWGTNEQLNIWQWEICKTYTQWHTHKTNNWATAQNYKSQTTMTAACTCHWCQKTPSRIASVPTAVRSAEKPYMPPVPS